MPKISVVIPLFNKEKYIARAIDSVLAQTLQDFEIIVVDDGSTDSSADIVQSIKDSRIRLIQQANSGVSVARNRGIEEAKADLIAFLDADDAWKPIFLETVLELRKKYFNAGLYATAYECVEQNGRVRIPKFKGIAPAPWDGIITNYYYASLGEPPVLTSAVVVPKEAISKVGGFVLGQKLGEDLDLWFRISLEYNIAFSNCIGATYFRDAANRTIFFHSNFVEPDRALKRNALKALNERSVTGKSAEYLREYIYKKDLEVATLMLWAGKKKEARKLLKENRTKVFIVKKIWLYLCLIISPKVLFFLYQIKDKILGLK